MDKNKAEQVANKLFEMVEAIYHFRTAVDFGTAERATRNQKIALRLKAELVTLLTDE